MPLVSEDMVQAAFDYLDDKDEIAAQAFADLVIAEFRRKKTRAALIRASSERQGYMKEAEADCHPDMEEAYIVEAQAVKAVEWHRRQKARAEAAIETWRTQESSARSMRRVG